MRVNVYAEELTDRIEIISKTISGQAFTGLRIYLELPVTIGGQQHQGPFIHGPGDDDSSAVTFWGKRDLRTVLRKALTELDAHYAAADHAAQSISLRTNVSLSEDQIKRLETMGWEFIQVGPDEWTWMKFTNSGIKIAAQGSSVWAADCTAAVSV